MEAETVAVRALMREGMDGCAWEAATDKTGIKERKRLLLVGW
jgi:hypothetical protein